MKVNLNSRVKALGGLGIMWSLATTLLLGPQALGQGAGESDDSFQIGGSCAALAYVSSGSLRSLIAGGFADDFHSFCYPEEPSECTDYTSFLKGIGRLTTGEDGYHCSLHVN